MNKERLKIDRTGEINFNNQECLMKIIKYNNAKDIVIEFQDEYKYQAECKYQDFKKGSVKNKFYPTIYEKGYIGNTTSKVNGVKKKSYEVWMKMMQRAYDKKLHKVRQSYKDVKVCDEWLCYATFEKWFNENYYEIKDETMCLDKDILVKGNKIYSSDTCIFVPNRINLLFIKSDKIRGKYPIGVYWHKKEKKFNASLNIKGKNTVMGRFDTPLEAFECYKKAKESEIKRVSDEYKNKIPQKLYNALYNYQVEITD